MLARSLYLLSGIALAQCQTIVFDGRVPANATAADFDKATSIFDPENVKGQNVTFSSLVRLSGQGSLFDTKVKAQTVEVTVNDDSIFAPGGSNPQTAVRRAELLFNSAKSADNITTTGVKTLHFSLKESAERPLNTTHEYLLTFLERGDFDGNQISLKTGTLIGSDGATKDDFVLLGNSKNGSKTLFSTPRGTDFTNFALKLDFDKNTVQVFSSTGNEALTQKTEPLPNDLSGNGAFHFGVNKNPINPGADSLRSGIQEAGILEGIVYGGIFVECSASGTVTLS
ncbi:hypothetical protein HBI56_213070 [Parastagonospora nodorum]|uniref:Glycoside hydrolase 131 catalytic N-terminal domain-containing protein n=1 Tax=Phaeosphaeria nodorum (strain SN15 / ATCC MYA-4574 / FGSC 10173) TaxID=321614 RepID=A0A7U2FEC3_PHANO|nr:hypothetical protein HBH56_229000 [Parastagonospora nodorum]QRD03689.1 hypothetical protein JI435_160170 [Parastagonospora nodorum SN15]KAH3921776.1 hypothetical protein HBH54_233760 [Parastagonospora nodorum]KAH3939874.1 hypothetical protein HBH53_227640 [Parastagonospora nodorum]KAH3960834.1 hypothetical protein HBH52_234280 [Parastagonospora nodorum]